MILGGIMQNIYIVFDDDHEDADLICVPDEIANNIDNIVQLFFNWMGNKHNNHTFWAHTKSGFQYLLLGTDEFIWWLNNHYLHSGEMAIVIERHVRYNPRYKMACF